MFQVRAVVLFDAVSAEIYASGGTSQELEHRTSLHDTLVVR
jgi:hypothetical protein